MRVIKQETIAERDRPITEQWIIMLPDYTLITADLWDLGIKWQSIFSSGLRTWLGNVSASSDYHNKILQNRGLQQQKGTFSRFWRLRVQVVVSAGLVSDGTSLSLFCSRLLTPPCVLVWPFLCAQAERGINLCHPNQLRPRSYDLI